MKGKISIVTLLVADLKKSISFYRDGLGFPMDNADDDPSIAFFPLEGTWLALYPDERFAGEGVGNAGAAGDAPRFTLAHNVKTKKEVDSAVRLAASAGARVLEGAAGGLLGWLLRLHCGPGRTPLGNCIQPVHGSDLNRAQLH